MSGSILAGSEARSPARPGSSAGYDVGPLSGTRGARVARAFLPALLLLLASAAAVAGQSGDVTGRVEDASTGRAIRDASVQVAGTLLGTLTDAQGAFRITGVAAGSRTLRVTHVAYGARTVAIEVPEGQPVSIRVRLSETAIELEPIEVTGLTTEERADRAAGFRRGVVTRAQLASLERTNATLSEALRQYVPSVRARQVNLVGSPVCIELRTVRATFRNECLSPAVYLDGVPVTNPTLLYNTLDLSIIESLEVVPAAEAGARYGTGALYGALLIETRRPGGNASDRTRPSAARSPAFDWSQDPQSHPTTRSLLFAFLGNAAGLAIGLSAADECIGTRKPSNDRIIALCDSGKTTASAFAALTLPAFGGALGSTLGGRTEASKGKLLPAIAGAAMVLLPAYGVMFSAERMDSEGLRMLGRSLLVVGVPLITTFSDHQFRNRRGNNPP